MAAVIGLIDVYRSTAYGMKLFSRSNLYRSIFYLIASNPSHGFEVNMHE